MFESKRVGVLMGGLSAERDISLTSGETALAALRSRGYDAVALLADRQLDLALRASPVDVIFNALHGRYGEDGCIQGLLELIGIPYTGSGVLASALAMNKIKAKEIFRLHHVPTPPSYVLHQYQQDQIDQVHGTFGFPVVVKPAREGSSLGVSLAHDRKQLRLGCREAFRFDRAVLVERFISGREACVGILNGRPLGALGIVANQPIFDYEAKYCVDHAHYHLRDQLSSDHYDAVLTQAMRAHQALGCWGASRVDMIISDIGNEYVLEVQTVPGLTPRSLLPRMAEQAGMAYAELIEAILSTARLHQGGLPADGPRDTPVHPDPSA